MARSQTAARSATTSRTSVSKKTRDTHQTGSESSQPFYSVQISSHSSIAPSASPTASPCNIPLNLLALVIAYLDDHPPTLASLCRTSRLLYYMTLPHLWKKVTLRSHKGFLRRADGQVEGVGGGSPFSMGLNALVTHNVASLVHDLELTGERASWQEEEEASQAGRVSETGMMLGIAVRAAVDKCPVLEGFTWNLDTRIMPNVLTGLSSLRTLERLWLRFPSRRCPGPTGELPVLARLKEFTFTDYDPLCYPDDMSRMLEGARKLEVLNCHFSPRMRQQGEPSVQLSHFFRRNIASRRKLRLRRLGIYNLFARAEGRELVHAIEMKGLEDVTFLNTFGPDEGETTAEGTRNSFLDRTWLADDEPSNVPTLNTMRIDQLHRVHSEGLPYFGLKYLYLINARYGKGFNGVLEGTSEESSPAAATGSAGWGERLPTPVTTPTSTAGKDSLRDSYLDNICKYAGPTLQHLIFPAKWPLTTQQIAKLIRACPQLTQLSVSIQDPNLEVLAMVVPFLTKLYAIRINMAAGNIGWYGTCALVDIDATNLENKIRAALATEDYKHIKYVGLGSKIWEIGDVVAEVIQVPLESSEDKGEPDEGEGPQYREEIVKRRGVKHIELQDVKDVAIWKCDTLDVV